jgi:hypothetical protein
MKATDYLKSQHRQVERLFERIESTEGETKAALFQELAAHLVAHDTIEREIFYPACEDIMGINDVMGEALVEHGLVEFSLLRADENLQGEHFDAFIAVLKENVSHHVKEEEEKLFPRVADELASEEEDELLAEMQQRFAQAIAADWRQPLVENVLDVLSGALKTGTDRIDDDADTLQP